MNTSIYRPSLSIRQSTTRLFVAVIVCSIGLTASLFAQNTVSGPDDDSEVLTRGPVHEAFAGTITYNPEAGMVVAGSPPADIEEQAPDLKPEGNNVVWIAGYWAWDDDRNNFIWISGVWRDIPPGRQWIPGYWNKADGGFQWISGYWSTKTVKEPEYLPEPPETLESGPNIEAPSVDYVWVPGVWAWRGRYVWRPGYWTAGRPDLFWVPDTYVWTPRGCVYVGGYWDYPVVRRGVLFAPVYWDSPVYVRTGYYYRPSVVISLSIFSDCLFVRPRYHHYYFGDYYAAGYRQNGFQTSISINIRRGYDPIYSRQRWEHRRDRNWEQNVRRDYEQRRDNESARPPRSFAEQQRRASNSPQTAQRDNSSIAVPLTEAAAGTGRRSDSPKFQKVSATDKDEQIQNSRQTRQNAVSRQKEEGSASPSVATTVSPQDQNKKDRANRTQVSQEDRNGKGNQRDKSDTNNAAPWKRGTETKTTVSQEDSQTPSSTKDSGQKQSGSTNDSLPRTSQTREQISDQPATENGNRKQNSSNQERQSQQADRQSRNQTDQSQAQAEDRKNRQADRQAQQQQIQDTTGQDNQAQRDAQRQADRKQRQNQSDESQQKQAQQSERQARNQEEQAQQQNQERKNRQAEQAQRQAQQQQQAEQQAQRQAQQQAKQQAQRQAAQQAQKQAQQQRQAEQSSKGDSTQQQQQYPDSGRGKKQR